MSGAHGHDDLTAAVASLEQRVADLEAAAPKPEPIEIVPDSATLTLADTQPDPEPTPDPEPGGFDFDVWRAGLPDVGEMRSRLTVEPPSDNWFGARASSDVVGRWIDGGRTAVVRVDTAGLTVDGCLLEGADDGIKSGDRTVVVDTIIGVRDFGEGGHGDHIQASGAAGLTVRRTVFVAGNRQGQPSRGGWNAAIWVDGTSGGRTVIEDVHVEAGNVQSWFPIRVTSGTVEVRRLVVDRGTMKGEKVVNFGDAVTVAVWDDVWVRESDGTLTPVPDPAA